MFHSNNSFFRFLIFQEFCNLLISQNESNLQEGKPLVCRVGYGQIFLNSLFEFSWRPFLKMVSILIHCMGREYPSQYKQNPKNENTLSTHLHSGHGQMDGFSLLPSSRRSPYGDYLIDIGLNLLDDMFFGFYNGNQKHPEDVQNVITRAKSMGVVKCIITCGSIADSAKCLTFLENMPRESALYMTVGIHPTRCDDFQRGEDLVIEELSSKIEQALSSKDIVAIGECGLDYDRLEFCGKELQRIGFLRQLELAERYNLPLFLHDRNTDGDFLAIMTEYLPRLRCGGVVHSFTGTLSEMTAYTSLGLYIGVNGCSLKTEESLSVVAQIPLSHILLETDAPWCGIKNTHASKRYIKTEFPTRKREKYEVGVLVKDRSEPCQMVHVLEVVAAIKGINIEDLAKIVYENTLRLFPLLKNDE
jgi:TatD DNase family protein